MWQFVRKTFLQWLWTRVQIVRVTGLVLGGAVMLVGSIYAMTYYASGHPRDALWMAKVAGCGAAAFAVGAFAQWGSRLFGWLDWIVRGSAGIRQTR